MKQKDIAPGWRYLNRESGEVRRVAEIVEGQVSYWVDGIPSPVPYQASLKEFTAWGDERIPDAAPWKRVEEQSE